MAQGSVTGTRPGHRQGRPRRGPAGRHGDGRLDARSSRAMTTTSRRPRRLALPRAAPRRLRPRGRAPGLQEGPPRRDPRQPRARRSLSTSSCRSRPSQTEVVVTAEAPVVSVVANKVSTSFGGDYIDKQAVPRNYYQVITSAPGVNIDSSASQAGSAMLAYGGTTSRARTPSRSTASTSPTPASGDYWLLPSIQWMEEIQVGRPRRERRVRRLHGRRHQRRHEVGRQRVQGSARGLLPARLVRLGQLARHGGRDVQVRGLRLQPRRPDRQGQALVLRQRRVLAPGHDPGRRHRHVRPEGPALPRQADLPAEREEPDLRDGRVRQGHQRAARYRRLHAPRGAPRSRTARTPRSP